MWPTPVWMSGRHALIHPASQPTNQPNGRDLLSRVGASRHGGQRRLPRSLRTQFRIAESSGPPPGGGLGKFPGHQGRECRRPSADPLTTKLGEEGARVLGRGRLSSRGAWHGAADSRGLIVIPTVMQLAQRRYGRTSCRPLLGANPTGITHVVFSTTPFQKKFVTCRQRAAARVSRRRSPALSSAWLHVVCLSAALDQVRGSALMMIFPLKHSQCSCRQPPGCHLVTLSDA